MLKDNHDAKRSFLFTLVLTAIFFLSAPHHVAAQTGGDSTLLQDATLPMVVQYAIKNQPAVQQSLLDEQITDYQIKSKLADWYPQVNFGYLLQHNFQTQTNIIGGNPVKLGVDNTSALQFSLSQTIFNRDVLLARRTGADVRKLARQQTQDTRINLAVDVSKAFYDILATRQQQRVINENILRLDRSLKDAKARFDAGFVDKTDYKRATIALNNAKATQRSLQEAEKAKTSYLKTLLNYPAEASISFLYDSTALEQEAQLDTLQLPDYTHRIEYNILETQQRLQEANLRYNKWSFLPSVAANAAYNMNFLNDNFGKLYNQSYPNSYAGLTLTVPIFQGGKRKYNIRQSELELQQTGLQITAFRNAVNSEYEAAIASYKSNLANYSAMRENVALAKEVYDVINLQYQAGLKTYLEVITAETDLRTSQINYFDALYQLLSSKVDVQKSTGALNY